MTTDVSGRYNKLTILERRRLGFTRAAVREHAIALIKAGTVKAIPVGANGLEEEKAWRSDICEAIATSIIQDNLGSWRELAGASERDWSEFFDALIAFIEKLMPLIEMLITIFGGL